MESLLNAFLFAHIFCGFSSLILFFVPIFARKGSLLHNRVGRWYVRAMWGVVVTATILSVMRLTQGIHPGSLFLGYLAFLTARPLYYGIAVLKIKQGASPKKQRIDQALRLAVGLGGPVMVILGSGLTNLSSGNSLLVIFGLIGSLTTIPSLVNDLRGNHKPINWLEEHIGGMLVSAIAAFTAFLAFGGNQVFGGEFDGTLRVVIWITPTVVGVLLNRYYTTKSNVRRVTPKQVTQG